MNKVTKQDGLDRTNSMENYKETIKIVLQTREKVRSRRINLEGDTHAQESMQVNTLYSYPYLN
jgi:hypothetical protein